LAAKSPPKGLRLEKLQPGHIPAILEIEKHANAAPWSERSFENELTHEHGVFLVAFIGADLVGYAGMWLVVDEAHITTVAVDPEFRRQGIARRLMVELLARAHDAGMLGATLEVRAGNEAAIGLYEALGFVRSAVRRRYYPDNKEDAVVMWLYDLERALP